MNILITGTSGSGKSTIGRALKDLGYGFIEADVDTYHGKSIAYWTSKKTKKGRNMPWPPPENWHNENNWTWRVDVLQQKINEKPKENIFVCGDSRNKTEALHLFDKIFVLSVDDDTLRHRLETRTDNYFGKSADQLAWVLEENKTIVVEMTKFGAIPINTNKPVGQAVDEILSKLTAD